VHDYFIILGVSNLHNGKSIIVAARQKFTKDCSYSIPKNGILCCFATGTKQNREGSPGQERLIEGQLTARRQTVPCMWMGFDASTSPPFQEKKWREVEGQSRIPSFWSKDADTRKYPYYYATECRTISVPAFERDEMSEMCVLHLQN
jgi:hypothetical protein